MSLEDENGKPERSIDSVLFRDWKSKVGDLVFAKLESLTKQAIEPYCFEQKEFSSAKTVRFIKSADALMLSKVDEVTDGESGKFAGAILKNCLVVHSRKFKKIRKDEKRFVFIWKRE